MIPVMAGMGLLLAYLFIFSARRDLYHSPFTAWVLSFLRVCALGITATLAIIGLLPQAPHSQEVAILVDGSEWTSPKISDEFKRVVEDVEGAGASVSIGVLTRERWDEERQLAAFGRPVSLFTRWDTALLWSLRFRGDRSSSATAVLLMDNPPSQTNVAFIPEMDIHWLKPHLPSRKPALAFYVPPEGMTGLGLPVKAAITSTARNRKAILYSDDTLVESVDLFPEDAEPFAGDLERVIRFEKAGPHVIRLHLADETGRISYQEIRNVTLAEKPSVYYVSLSARKTPLRKILEAEGYSTRHIPVSSLLNRDSDLFQNGKEGDLIILDSVPKEYLGSQTAAILTDSIQSKGLSLLVIPDQIAENPDRTYAINRILPVKPGLDENDDEERTLALVAVVDTSFSMYRKQDPVGPRKIEMAQEALINLSAAMKDSDLFGVLGVDFSPYWILYPNQNRDLASEINRIRRMGALSGGINLYSGLLTAFQELEKTDADIRHILVLLDTADVDEYEVMGTGSVWDLLQQFNEGGITISIVGIGGSGDDHIPFLNQFAEEAGGFLYIASDIHDVPGFFLEDLGQVSDSPVLRRPMKTFFPSVEFPGMEKLPGIEGHVLVTPKPGSNLLTWSEPGYALLVSWRLGRGNVAVFTADSGSVLARKWMDIEHGPLWNRIIAKIVRPPESSGILFPVEVPGGTRLSLRLPESSGHQILEGTVDDDLTETAVLAFQEKWPGEYGAFLPQSQWKDPVVRISPGTADNDRVRIFEKLTLAPIAPGYHEIDKVPLPDPRQFDLVRENLSDPSIFRLVLLLAICLFITDSVLRLS